MKRFTEQDTALFDAAFKQFLPIDEPITFFQKFKKAILEMFRKKNISQSNKLSVSSEPVIWRPRPYAPPERQKHD